jgi:hypothetical protein
MDLTMNNLCIFAVNPNTLYLTYISVYDIFRK